jgi:hypothetical protein
MADALDVQKTQFSVLDFLEWQRSGGLNLRPYYQRGSVWTAKSKSYLIDTLVRGFPIPIIFLQMKTDQVTLKSVRQVVDGQQRLRTILAYIERSCLPDADERDEFAISRAHNRELAGKSFDHLPPDVRTRITSTQLPVHVLPTNLDDAVLLQLFARLNSTGTKLNDQELRNAEYHGAFKSLAYQLSYAEFARWRSWDIFSAQGLAQMREVELSSELLLLLLDGPQGRSKAALDNLYEENDDDFPQAELVSTHFSAIFDILDDLYTPDRRGQSLGAFQSQSWLYSLFALCAAATLESPLRKPPKDADQFARFPDGLTVRALRPGLLRAQSTLLDGDVPEELAKALRGASTDRASRAARYNFLIDHLR